MNFNHLERFSSRFVSIFKLCDIKFDVEFQQAMDGVWRPKLPREGISPIRDDLVATERRSALTNFVPNSKLKSNERSNYFLA